MEKNMKKFYFVLLALGLAACGQEQSQKADAEQYFLPININLQMRNRLFILNAPPVSVYCNKALAGILRGF
ncbi:TPA: hypothetical protein ACLBHV_001285 [Neisseria meningitidis]